MQKGFSLIEMLVVSLFGSFLLLATSHALTTLIKYQTQQSELLRLAERSYLAEIALKNAVNKAQRVLKAGEATNNYPNLKQLDTLLGYPKDSTINFDQFASSDWMLLSHGQDIAQRSLFHLDDKTYGYGLAFRDFEKNTSRSDTLVNQVELMRLRFFYEDDKTWVKGNQVIDSNKIRGVQFAFLITSSQPIKKTSPSEFILWDEKLVPPNDGHYRQLISATARTRMLQ